MNSKANETNVQTSMKFMKKDSSGTGSSEPYISHPEENAISGKESGFRKPPVCLVIGMAGSGKTTLVDALAAYAENEGFINKIMNRLSIQEESVKISEMQSVSEQQYSRDIKEERGHEGMDSEVPQALQAREDEGAGKTGDQNADQNDDGDGTDQVFVINIDPAVQEVPYEPNIDIRDVIDFHGVMRDYGLGPNGAIMTSLNLYATRFDQVLNIIERRSKDMSLFVVDTPGQIETFTWSASGMIIADALAMTLPTVALFVVDAARASSPMTFVSNMLHACSILYKTRLPLVVVFNKVDVADAEKLNLWMRDFDNFDRALQDDRFVGNLARSLAMALDQFYTAIPTVAVSALTGEGMSSLLGAINRATEQYEREYKPFLEKQIQQRTLEKTKKMQEDFNRFRADASDDPGYLGGHYDDQEDGDNECPERSRERDRPNQLREDRVLKKGNEEQSDQTDEEEREAYEELKKYLAAIKGKPT